MYKKIVMLALLVIIAGGAGLFVYKKKHPTPGTNTVTVGDVDFTVSEGGKVELVADTAMPEITEPVFDKEVPKETRAKVMENFSELRTALTEDPNNYNAWLDLALHYKVAGDIRSSEKIWLYLYDAAPQQSLSAHNLGTLYHLTFKEYAKSEKYFEEAIRREPDQAINYLSFYELYRYSYKTDTTRAIEILEAGMRAIPDNPDLPLTLGTYYHDVKRDNKKAAEYYLKARDIVVEAGNIDLARRIESDIESLK